ncbi:outer membrane lipoprotein chaperone LolA [Thioalkalicoccus limnaeus]|uniref:Outer-membrane lipoprotein carrier protein n=1 Tax=Thioalkalicoccus limnaeus TaxID=120681 RepID=A0ABV4BEC2_9GAMM
MHLVSHRRSRNRSGSPGVVARASLLLVLLFTWFAVSGASATDGVKQLDAYLTGLETLQADFRQTTFNADRSQMLESDGRFYLKRPGQFRWEYQVPFKQLIVADGRRVYVHDPELEQVYHRSQREALRGTPALLLTEDGPFDRVFDLRPIEGTGEREWLELRPKAADTEIERIELGFLGDQLDTLVMVDRFGQVTHLRFHDIRRNPRLDGSLFRFDHSIGGDFLEFD